MNVAVASQNPVKIRAARRAFVSAYPGSGLKIAGHISLSNVSDQPISDRETLQGALNRLKYLQKRVPTRDYWLALEGGINRNYGKVQSFAWVAVTNGRLLNSSRTATFTLPPKVVHQIDQGLELGDAMDLLHAQKNSKQKQGAVGLLTKGLVTRTDLYTQAVILALIPFLD